MENGRPIHDNETCPVCGKRILCGVDCMRYRATVHLDHCLQCTYLERIFWHCTYRHKKSARR